LRICEWFLPKVKHQRQQQHWWYS